MLTQLEIYITAQKAMANYFMAFGVFLLILAILLYFVGTYPLFSGLKIGLLILGFLSLGSGYAYRISEEKLLKKQTELHQQSPSHFHKMEKERMAKVVKNYPKIQIALVLLVMVSLVVNLFLDKAFVNGILFSLVIFSVGNLIIESVSKQSIDTYFGKLSNL